MKQPKLKRNHHGRISKNAKKAFKKNYDNYSFSQRILNSFLTLMNKRAFPEHIIDEIIKVTPLTPEELKNVDLNNLPEITTNETP